MHVYVQFMYILITVYAYLYRHNSYGKRQLYEHQKCMHQASSTKLWLFAILEKAIYINIW